MKLDVIVRNDDTGVLAVLELVAIENVLIDTRIFVDKFPGLDEEEKTNELSLGEGVTF